MEFPSPRDLSDDLSGSTTGCLCTTSFCNAGQPDKMDKKSSHSSEMLNSAKQVKENMKKNIKPKPAVPTVKQVKLKNGKDDETTEKAVETKDNKSGASVGAGTCPEDFTLVGSRCYYVSETKVRPVSMLQ